MTKYQRVFLAVVCAAALLVRPLPMLGHVPYRPEVIFFSPAHPDRPVSSFAAGKVGVVQPSWALGYLVVAYRYFNGQPLSSAEQKSFLAQKELHPGFALEPFERKYEERLGPPQQWVQARAQFLRTKPPTNRYDSDWWKYTDGEGCLAGAFANAIRTLRDRALRFGAHSIELQEWIAGQDQVFLNCPRWWDSAKQEVLPEGLPLSSNPLLRADRAYQIAAAHFYARNFDGALHGFEAIAADQTSPWHELSAYLVARTLIQKGTADETPGVSNAEVLKQAEQRMRAFSIETKDAGLRRSALGLLNLIAIRLRPEAQLRIISSRISHPGTNFGQDVEDFNYLINRKIGPEPDFPGVEDGSVEYDRKLAAWRQERYQALNERVNNNEVADWILTMASWSPWSQQHALARWRSGRNLPWLVAAISKVDGRSSAAIELLEAAAQVQPGSPAYATLALHRGRLLRERQEFEQARRVLDAALEHSQAWPVSAVTLVKGERALVAAGLEEFVGLLGSQPLGFTNGAIDRGESEYCEDTGRDVKCERYIFSGKPAKRLYPQLTFNAAVIINERMPLELLVQAAQSPQLPKNLRLRLAPAVWARSALLERPDLAQTIAPDVVILRPELKPFITAYQQAEGPAERRFLAAFTIAHFPGLRPLVEDGAPRVTRFDYADNYRDNWWCHNAELDEFSWDSSYVERARSVPEPAFLTAEQRDSGRKDHLQLVQIGKPGDFLPAILIDWARRHPNDPRVPESLHFAWRVVRFSCDEPRNRTREIFLLLHSRYPDSPWTRKTRHWY